MCIAPSYIWVPAGPTYIKQPKGCGKCWRCKENRINDYVGRCLAEAAYSDWVKFLTLTYRPRDDRAELVIHPKHFQKFIRALRIRGIKCRYLAAAEYGSKKGRVHFHVILFGNGPEPIISKEDPRRWPNDERFWPDVWPHGHVHCLTGVSNRAVRYVCKYILKDYGQETWYSMSKKPPLGHQYFQDKAKEMVDNDLMPRSFEYKPPMGRDDRVYMMTGTTRRNYIKAIIEGLKARASRKLDHPNTHGLFKTTFVSLSEFVQKAVETIERREHVIQTEELEKRYPMFGFLALLERYNPDARVDRHTRMWQAIETIIDTRVQNGALTVEQLVREIYFAKAWLANVEKVEKQQKEHSSKERIQYAKKNPYNPTKSAQTDREGRGKTT